MSKWRYWGIIKAFTIALFWLLVWEGVSNWVELPFLLPGPVSTVRKMIELWGRSSFWLGIGGSLIRVILGFSLAVAIGLCLAAICSALKLAHELLSPIKSVIRSTPISSFIILVLLWLSVDTTPVFIAFLAVMPIIWQDVQQGISQTSGDLLEMGKAYGFSKRKTFFHIYIPSILPYFYAACASGMGFAWKACIAAEVIAKPLHSVGRNLQDAKVYLLTDELFAWTITVILFSMVLESGMKRLMNQLRVL